MSGIFVYYGVSRSVNKALYIMLHNTQYMHDILCVLCFLLCMFLQYVTVLLPVGVIKDNDDGDDDLDTSMPANFALHASLLF